MLGQFSSADPVYFLREYFFLPLPLITTDF